MPVIEGKLCLSCVEMGVPRPREVTAGSRNVTSSRCQPCHIDRKKRAARWQCITPMCPYRAHTPPDTDTRWGDGLHRRDDDTGPSRCLFCERIPRAIIWDRDGGQCYIQLPSGECEGRVEYDGNWQLDHANPRRRKRGDSEPNRRRGSNADVNIGVACRSCNLKKGTKSYEQFREYHPHLPALSDLREARRERMALVRAAYNDARGWPRWQGNTDG